MALRSSMSFDVTVLGEIYMDHVFSGFPVWPRLGEEIFTDQYTFELGGGAIITACALARLGRSVQLIGVVGDADLPLLSERLASFGLSANSLIRSSGRTGVSVSISTVHDRSFFTYRGVNQQLESLVAQNHRLLTNAAAARHVHLAFPLSAVNADTVLAALRQQGARISLDVGHHVEWLTSPDSHRVLQAVDYFLPNAKEATLLAGRAPDYLTLCRDLHLPVAVQKLGADGAAMLAGGVEYRVPAPLGNVVDTTGAGDVFNAGFIDALLDDAPPQLCLQHACACGTLSTAVAGALGSLPTRAEAELLREKTYVT